MDAFKIFLNKRPNFKKILEYTIPALLTGIILLTLLIHFRVTPFGSNTIATQDGKIQYIDYFSYYKNVLDGKDTISYSFSKKLGGNNFGVFSYYLSSPFNLLLKFFSYDNIENFYTLAVTIRILLASLTFYIFLKESFRGRKHNFWLYVLLSTTYALSNYTLSQVCNVIWLDGVWILPLMLLGVSSIFHEKRPALFIFWSVVALVCNWYSGFIALLFCAFWFFICFALWQMETKGSFKNAIKRFWSAGWRLLASTVLIVISSGIILIPSFMAMQQSSHGGGADWLAFGYKFRGEFLDSIANYYPGAMSDSRLLSIFIGALPLLVFVGMLFSKKVPIRNKIFYIGIYLLVLSLYYYEPFYFLFSLLKQVNSYWCRYSFGCLAILIFMTAYILDREELKAKDFLRASLAILTFFMACDYFKHPSDSRKVYALFIVFFSIVIAFQEKAKNKKIFTTILSVLLLLEFSGNAYLVLKKRIGPAEYSNYRKTHSTLISKIKQSDNSVYRISNLDKRCAFCNNDGLANNYMSINGYTSSPDDNQLKVLHSLGYRRWYFLSSVEKYQLPAADTLLAVKYLIPGSNTTKGYSKTNLKDGNVKVYENKNVLPIIFSIENSNFDSIDNFDNVFEFQNETYKKLSGTSIDIFSKVPFSKKVVDDHKIEYKLSRTSKSNTIIYADIESKNSRTAKIRDGETFETGYFNRITSSVVPISTNSVSIELDKDTEYTDELFDGEYFYELDLDKLKEVADRIKENNKAKDIKISPNYASFSADLDDDKSVFTSIPYQKGWEIYVNGRRISPKKFANSFIMLDLKKGKNKVEMEFTTPGLKEGIISSIIGVVLAIIFCLTQRKDPKLSER